MKRAIVLVSFALAFLASWALSGCGQKEKKEGNKDGSADAKKYRLETEPAGARGVLDTNSKSEDGQEVVVSGRVGGQVKPFIDGRVAFMIADTKFTPCNERPGDMCETPWDYCCDDRKELARGTLLVKVVDDKGKTIEQDAKEWLGVKELDRVVVQGTFKKAGDSVELLAKGIYFKK